MSGWFDTAASVFRRRVDDSPQTFEIRCGCGRTASGFRSRHAQTVVCEACRESIFVLPASVYPLPRQSRKSKPSPARSEPEPVDPPVPADDTKRSAARGASPSRAARKSKPAAPRAPREASAANLGPSAAGDRPEPRRRIITPVRLVLAGVVLVISLTGWWIFHLRSLDQAREILASAPRAAEDALQEGDFHEAARQFARLSTALDRLGRDDVQSRIWRQSARETAAISDLAMVSLHEILDEAAHAGTGADHDRWQEQFRGSYRGAWVVIDAPVIRNEDVTSGPRFTVDFPFAVEGCNGRLMADLPIFEKCVPSGTPARRIIFAGQIESCRLIPGSDPVWQLELRPQTAILWGSAETYGRLGLPIDDATTRILIEQSRLLGIES